MPNLIDSANLAIDNNFRNRVAAAAVHTALAAQTETTVDQQTITMGSVTAGTFTLTFLGQTTAALQWNTSASAVQAALNALSTIGTGGVECTGGPLPGTAIVVNFVGAAVNGGQPLLTHTDTLTGGTATVTHTTTGAWVVNHVKRAALASRVLANPVGYGVLMAPGVADNATVVGDFNVTNPGNIVLATGVTEATATNDIQFQMNSVFSSYA